MKRFHKFLGRALPFGEKSAIPFSDRLALCTIVTRGAFAQDVLDEATRSCHVRINHDSRQRISGASVRFTQANSGLYVYLTLPGDDPTSEELFHCRDEWQGLSVQWPHKHQEAYDDWDRVCAEVVMRIASLTEVSLVVGEHRPRFGGTWIEPYGPKAIARMKRENAQALIQEFGTDYTRCVPKALWLPIQPSSIEAVLQARFPERTQFVERGAVFGCA